MAARPGRGVGGSKGLVRLAQFARNRDICDKSLIVAGPWSRAQYEMFKQERQQPFYDLLRLVHPAPGGRVVDLGCGTGHLTAVLHRETGATSTLGIDSSPEMLAETPSERDVGLTFLRGDVVSACRGEQFDLIFSNAALHWIEDHERLLGDLCSSLRPQGQLLVQVPANHDHASHLCVAQVAEEPPFAEVLGGYRGHRNVLPVERYALLLHQLGLVDVQARLQVYVHRLPSSRYVVEWLKGTTLTPFAERLGSRLYERFVESYERVLLRTIGDSSPYLYTFKRIFLSGRAPG
jgi:trans-aconitate 2-methyltransferase